MNKQASRYIWVFLALAVLLVGCGIERDSWAGVTRTENEEIFVSYERFIAKLDAEGQRIWTYPPGNDRGANFFAKISYTPDTVFIGDYNGNVHAINRASGERRWIYEQSGTNLFGIFNFGGATDRIIGQIALGDGVIYVPDEKGVFILDAATGERDSDWMFETDRAVWSGPIYVPEVEGREAGLLYITSLDHRIYAVDAADASLIWERDLGGTLPSSPVYDAERGLLFVSSFASEVIAVNAEDGAILDRFETEGWVWDSPALTDETLFFGDLDGYLYSVNFSREGGFQENWRRHVAQDNNGKLRATPLLADNYVIVGSNNKRIYALDQATGDSLWSRDLEREFLSDLILVTSNARETQLIVTATDKSDPLLVGIRLENGNDGWTYDHKD